MYASLFYCLLVAALTSGLLGLKFRPATIAWGAFAVFLSLILFFLSLGEIDLGHIDVPGWVFALIFGGGGLLSTLITLLVHWVYTRRRILLRAKDQ